MPFDLHASSNAVWHHFTRSTKQMPHRVYVPLVRVRLMAGGLQRRDITDDTVVWSIMISLGATQTSANFHVHQVSVDLKKKTVLRSSGALSSTP